MPRLLPSLLAAAAAFAAAGAPAAFAQASAPKEQPAQAQGPIVAANVEIPDDEPFRLLAQIKKDVIQNDPLDDEYPPAFWKKRNDPKGFYLAPIVIVALGNDMDFVANTANIEEVSKSPRFWFQSVAEHLKELGDIRFQMEAALNNNRRDLYFSRLKKYMLIRTELEIILNERPGLTPEEAKRVKDAAEKRKKDREKAKAAKP